MTDKREYELQDGITKVCRSGLVLEADQTINAYPDILEDHGDVLQEVEQDESADDGVDEESDDE